MQKNSDTESRQKRNWTVVYWITVALFLCAIASFYRPAYGFSYLLGFGDHFNQEEIAGLHCYVAPNSDGNDGQFYAKISLDPLLLNPGTAAGVDSLNYRARRILLSWTAWLIGFGRPALVLQVFALQNVACWLALAWILIRWFPPLDFNNYLRWIGVLFSCGMLTSVRYSFVDGPSLMFIALAMAFLEQGRYKSVCATLMFGVLARETNVLALAALLDPATRNARELGKFAIRAACVCAPLACWIIYIHLRVPHPGPVQGLFNFSYPFAGVARSLRETASALFAGHFKYLRPFLAVLALTAQTVFIFLRCDWRQPWWRLGASFAVLLVFLGHPTVWGSGLAITRIILPMTLAFNILVPRGRHWCALLVIGNLSLVYIPIIVP